MTHDGLKYLSQIVKRLDRQRILSEFLNEYGCGGDYLPVGSEMATKWYVEQVLDAGCAFVMQFSIYAAQNVGRF
jgi:myo-inositol-1-phosphate synthase